MKTDLFQSCCHCWVFQICWHIECSTFTASSFRIWNSSTGMPSPPLALFIVMLFIPSPSDLICMCACVLSHFSCVKLCVTAWLQPTRLLCSWGFSGQEYWCGLLCPPPGDLPNPGIKPASFTSSSFAGRFFTTGATWEAPILYVYMYMYMCIYIS